MEQEKNTIKPLTLEINKDLWNDFKNSIPRDTTLNDAVVKLIKESLK